jgi:hypothetical protein
LQDNRYPSIKTSHNTNHGGLLDVRNTFLFQAKNMMGSGADKAKESAQGAKESAQSAGEKISVMLFSL